MAIDFVKDTTNLLASARQGSANFMYNVTPIFRTVFNTLSWAIIKKSLVLRLGNSVSIGF